MSDDVGAKLDGFKAADADPATDSLAEIIFYVQSGIVTLNWLDFFFRNPGFWYFFDFTYFNLVWWGWCVFLAYGFVSVGELVAWFFLPDHAEKMIGTYSYWGSIGGYGVLIIYAIISNIISADTVPDLYWYQLLGAWIITGASHVVFKDRFVARWQWLSANKDYVK